MSHKHAHLMRSIFQDPPSANIHWREIESLLNHLGAEVEPAHGRCKVTLNKVETFLHPPHGGSTCSRTDIKAVREMLLHAGITLAAYESGS
ncbi:type II toxin-antitoxin system HicA family toxin [Quatrionicoccus australiensis]|uniref:type II toxin-antitoxin system HicA family toxin n=1 Tax=Quatrionicoccus australiensis TaxID=138118 RepID=UPI001CF80344|nr:type II toxin-antitoxin system HicA family toxin [Quatrionicoccus australiensis]MCB4360558.1 type II toxin-antitoxin system HicA family toxin [Quatrionicoccus australiensis]UCV15654.1 type II toxin-antitoxin system HicA family toxin [Quatrionicoccus australiensis]